MITFEHQGIQTGQHLLNVWRGLSGVRQNTQPDSTIAKYELRGLSRIMRYRIRQHLQITDRKRGMTVNDDGFPQFPATSGCVSAVSEVHRGSETPRETPDAADVIVMLVGDKDGIKGFRSDTKTTKAPHGFSNTETAVKQYARAPGLHQQPVALAAAAERRKTDHCKGLQKKAGRRYQPGACTCAGKLTSTDQKAGSVCGWRYRTFHACRLY